MYSNETLLLLGWHARKLAGRRARANFPTQSVTAAPSTAAATESRESVIVAIIFNNTSSWQPLFPSKLATGDLAAWGEGGRRHEQEAFPRLLQCTR